MFKPGGTADIEAKIGRKLTWFDPVAFAKGAAPKAGGGGIVGAVTSVVGAVTGAGDGGCGNGMVNGKRGFQPGNHCHQGRNQAVTAAQKTHTAANAVTHKHIRAGTLNTPEGRAAVRTAAKAARVLKDARGTHQAAQKATYSANAKARRAVAKGTASSIDGQAASALKAAHAAANPTKVTTPTKAQATKPATTTKEHVVNASKEASDIKVGHTATHLGDLHAGVKAGAIDAAAAHGHIDKIAKGASKDELFAAAKANGIEHKAKTKKALVEHLKAHATAGAPAAQPKTPKVVATKTPKAAKPTNVQGRLEELRAKFQAGKIKESNLNSHVNSIVASDQRHMLAAGLTAAGGKTLTEHHSYDAFRRAMLQHVKGGAAATPKSEPAKERFGKSQAKVQGSNFGREAAAGLPHTSAAAADRVLGRKGAIDDLPSIVGAPHDAKVHVENFGDRLVVTVRGKDYSATRDITRDARGKLVMHNENFFVDKGAQGKGLGSKVFGQQVEQARKLGVDRIETTAARTAAGDSAATNGYYTWARMGYDARLPPTVKAKLTPELSGASRVSDLMRTPAGRDFWKENGKTIKMRFDLHPDSLSSRIHADYLRERDARAGGSP